MRHLPVIERGAERSLQLDVARRVTFQQGLKHAELDVIGIEMLCADEFNVGAGQPASHRPRIAPARVRHEARVGVACGVGAASSLAVFGQMLAPASRQKRVEVPRRTQVGVNVAIDDAQARRGVPCWGAESVDVTFEYQAHVRFSLSRG
jgi:hypothetical protein